MTVRTSILALAVGLLATASPASAQTSRGSEPIGGGPSAGEPGVPQGRFVFAAIGIDDYEHDPPWKSLDNAVNDVEAMRQTLVDHFGFESPDEWILTDSAATKDAIERLGLRDLRSGLGPDDNLVLFYAGHGTNTIEVMGGDTLGRTGYIVPRGAKFTANEDPSQYYEIEDLLEDIARLPARHILVILDSCYSGFAVEGGFKSRGGSSAVTQEVADLVERRSRRVITSAQSDQEAADGGADFPTNSLFTGWLTEGLRTAASGGTNEDSPDSNGDGRVTVTEMYAFVRGRVGSDSQSRQTPDFGSFEHDDRGELVLNLQVDLFDELYRDALEWYDADKVVELAAAVDDAVRERPEGARSSYLRYALAELRDDLPGQVAALRELRAFGNELDDIPMFGSASAVSRALGRAVAACGEDCPQEPAR